jgi:DHA1 family bicyclomycin/chloramphenicol resistance-like MFS transporter
MSLVSSSSALIIEIYAFPVEQFGVLFALTGLSVLIGSVLNRWLLERLDAIRMIGIGTTILGVAGLQLLIMAWLGEAPFWWLWGNACLFMFGTALVLPNTTALALDPVPEIAGTAASIIGTLQNVVGAGAAIINSAIYSGTIHNLTLFVGVSGAAAFALFLLQPLMLKRQRASPTN